MVNGVFNRSYCCYGNLLCHEDSKNVSTNTSNWAVLGTMIAASIKLHYNDPSKSIAW